MPQCAVPYEGGEAGRFGGAGVLGYGPAHLVGEQVERTGAVAGLGHAVRHQQQRLVNGDPPPPDLRRPGREPPEAERQPGPRRQGAHPARPDGERRLVPEQQDVHRLPLVVGEGEQDGRGGGGPPCSSEVENLGEVAVGAAQGDGVPAVPDHPRLQPLADRHQLRLVVRGLTERAEQRGRRLHRPQALALHVADQHAGAVRAGLDVVEVAADAGVGVGGEVDTGVVEAAPAGRQRAQHGTADGVGDVVHVQRAVFVAHADRAGQGGEDAAEGDEDEVGAAGPVFVRPGAVGDDVRHQGEDREEGRAPHAADRGGDGGYQHDPGDHAELADGVVVGHGDGDEQQQRRHPGHAAAPYPQQLLAPHDVAAPGPRVPDERVVPLAVAAHGPSETRARTGRIPFPRTADLPGAARRCALDPGAGTERRAVMAHAAPASRRMITARRRPDVFGARTHTTVKVGLPVVLGLVYGYWAAGNRRDAGPITGWNLLFGFVTALVFAVLFAAVCALAPRLRRELHALCWFVFAGGAVGFLYNQTGASVLSSSGLGLAVGAGVLAMVFYRYYTHEDAAGRRIG
ncbi:hypothetical protein QFZ55_004263 [Streptomyces luteogriseus]|nr:hypothetical protein [Streptomyces luteogriseus]